MRLPRRLDLLGRVVEVKLASAEELRDVVADEAGAKAAWDTDTDTIYVLRTLSGKERNRAFWHEIMHALIDRFDP